jgi:hypothetical protein
MDLKSRLRSRTKAARQRGAPWVKAFDALRLPFAEGGWARIWTQVVHRNEIHQATPHTAEERYPELFDQAAALAPHAERILSFGCSTGAELIAIRRRFPQAHIVGVEINPRSRRLARRRVAGDARTIVISPAYLEGPFDIIFALAVLQRLPHQVAETQLEDISSVYPFRRFEAEIERLVNRLRPGGLLCVFHAHFPVELASIFPSLEVIAASPLLEAPVFGRDGRRLAEVRFHSIFRKV